MALENLRDAFDVMGLPPAYEIDAKTLDARQRDLSRALHPDRHVAATPSQRRMALSEAISVNEAHRALKDKLKRAELLCARLGVGDATKAEASTAFLFEIMELRERLSSARRSGNLDEVLSLAAGVRAKQAATEASVAATFAQYLMVPPPGEAHSTPELLADLGQLRYFRRFLDEVEAIEDELD